MPDPPCCSVGARPDAAEIDAALRRGDGLGTVCKRHAGLVKGTLGRHRRGCLGIDGVALAAAVEAVEDAAAEALLRRRETPGDTPSAAETEPVHHRPAHFQAPFGDCTREGVGGGVAGVATHPDTPRDDARATRLSEEVEGASLYSERVMLLADMIGAGEWRGRPTAKRLAAEWGVSADAVRNYARAAAVVCAADHGEIEQHRQESLGRWSALYDEAMTGVDGPDLKAAAAALAGYDRASGIVQPGGAKLEVNLLQNPHVSQLVLASGKAVVTLIRLFAPGQESRAGALYRALFDAIDAGDPLALQDAAAWLEDRARVVEAPLLPEGRG